MDKNKRLAALRDAAKAQLMISKKLERAQPPEEVQRRKELESQNIYYVNEQSFEDSYYKLGRVLGEGCLGVVKQCTRISDGIKFAVKVV